MTRHEGKKFKVLKMYEYLQQPTATARNQIDKLMK